MSGLDSNTLHTQPDYLSKDSTEPTDAVSAKLSHKQKRTRFIIALVAGAFLIAVLWICISLSRGLNEFHTENASLYTWFTTEKLEYKNSELVFSRKDNSVTELKIDDKTEIVESTPFFYDDERKALFPQEMILVQPRANNGQQDRLPSLSILDGTSVEPRILFADYRHALGSAFIFDGNDLYFFVNPITLFVDDKTFSLPEFSFVTYNYNHELYIYPYNEDNPTYVERAGSVRAEAENYKIDLATDTFESNGKPHLLVKKASSLETLK